MVAKIKKSNFCCILTPLLGSGSFCLNPVFQAYSGLDSDKFAVISCRDERRFFIMVVLEKGKKTFFSVIIATVVKRENA